MTGRIGPTVQTGQIVQTVRIVMAVRTGRTETAVAARTVTAVVVPAGTETAVVKAGRTNALAHAAASPNRPAAQHLRLWRSAGLRLAALFGLWLLARLAWLFGAPLPLLLALS